MKLNGKKVVLREKTPEDAFEDYDWQRDPELAHLDGISPTKMTFEEYQAKYMREMRYFVTGFRHFMAIDTLEGIHIGNCAYYGMDEEETETELGILIGNREYWNKGYGEDVVTTLVSHVFETTELKRIYLKTLEKNKRAQACFKKCGFVPYVTMVLDGSSYVFMEISRKMWKKRPAEKEPE